MNLTFDKIIIKMSSLFLKLANHLSLSLFIYIINNSEVVLVPKKFPAHCNSALRSLVAVLSYNKTQSLIQGVKKQNTLESDSAITTLYYFFVPINQSKTLVSDKTAPVIVLFFL